MMKNGFIKLHRKMMEWEWYTDSKTVHFLIHCIYKANWKDKKWRGKVIKRGQFVTSLSHLAMETGMSVKEVRLRIKRLEDTGEITCVRTNQFTRITVCNYETYQDKNEEEGKRKSSKGQAKGNQRAIKGQSKGNQRATTEEREEYKEREEREEDNNPDADRIGNTPKGKKRYGLDDLTSKELEERAELIYQEYPRKVGKKDAIKKIIRALKSKEIDSRNLFRKVKAYAEAVEGQEKEYIPYPGTWFNQHRFLDDPEEWEAWKKPEQKSMSYEKMFELVSSGQYRQADFEKVPSSNPDEEFRWKLVR